MFWCIYILVSSGLVAATVPNQNCGSRGSNSPVTPDQGQGSQSIERYFYDASIHACLAFAFKGQGGDGNNFESLKQCEDLCVRSIADYSACQGTGQQCKWKPDAADPCPDKESCDIFPMGAPAFDGSRDGQCCRDDIYPALTEARNGVCKPLDQFGKGDGVRIGRTCDYMPCLPDTEQCQMANEHFAICCPKA